MHATGPRTAEGKQRSSQNSFRHGLYSERIVLPNENLADYERFRSALIAEHQPANTTEMFLLDELAQNGWKIRRFRALEAFHFAEEDDPAESRFLVLVQRALASAERAFHRSLTALTKMQKQRGFVPLNSTPDLKSSEPARNPAPQNEQEFVPQNPPTTRLPGTQPTPPTPTSLETELGETSELTSQEQTAAILENPAAFFHTISDAAGGAARRCASAAV